MRSKFTKTKDEHGGRKTDKIVLMQHKIYDRAIWKRNMELQLYHITLVHEAGGKEQKTVLVISTK